jgi:hypothetical protein
MKTGKYLKPDYHNLLMILDANSPMVATVQERALLLVKSNSKARVTGVALPVEDGVPKSILSLAKSTFKAAGINYKGYLLKNSNRQLFTLIKEKQYDLIVLGIGSDEEDKAIEQSALLITLLAKVTCDLLIIRPDQITEFIPPHFQSKRVSKGSSLIKDKLKAATRELPQGEDSPEVSSNSIDRDKSAKSDESQKGSKTPYEEEEKQGGGNIPHDEESISGGNIPDGGTDGSRGSKVPADDDESYGRGKIPEGDKDRNRRGKIPEVDDDERLRRGLIPNNDDDTRKRRGRVPSEVRVDEVHRRGKIPGESKGDENQRKGQIPTVDDSYSGYSSDEIHTMMDNISFFHDFSKYEKKRCANTERSIVVFEADTEIIKEGGRTVNLF